VKANAKEFKKYKESEEFKEKPVRPRAVVLQKWEKAGGA
jgi:hypothetical protein